MANIKLTLQIEDPDSPNQALGVAQEIIAMLTSRFRTPPHTITGEVQIPCPDCGKLMEVQGREIVCPACIAEWGREFNLDTEIKRVALERRHGPQQPLEVAVM